MEFLIAILCICLVGAILLYPLYTAMGGKKTINKYIKNL